ncbi:hypothetical protein J4217_03010 [Candidatus Pacearchaeota archaeon]|nr:hypothetical protein [Candidatus Pacearchaeota archaeon]
MEHEKYHAEEHDDMKGGKKSNTETTVQYVIIAVLVILLIYSGVKIYGAGSSSISGNVAMDLGTVSALDVLPKGTPAVYGKELGVSYNDVSVSNPQLADATMQKLAKYEDMQLNSAQMERYIRIGSSIACEYCCGAQTLVFENGERACGCAHSYAMRGLAKYLLTKHPDISDIEILNELGKWKVLFFPGVHEQKAEVLKANGIDYTNQTVGYIYLASNIYRGAENQATASSSGGSQMVGGC